MKDLFQKLGTQKIKTRFNHKPIEMALFLSFLTVDVTKSNNHIGSCNGWTQYHGDDNLVISGAIVNRGEYLDGIKYKTKLNNSTMTM